MHTLLFLVGTLHAQDPAPPTSTLARARAAAELPALATRLRAAGVDAAEVRDALDAGRAAGAEDTSTVLQGAAEAAEDGAAVPQLGRFVKERLNEGLRGKALADAIHAEHARRKGEHGKADDHGRNGEQGKADGHGRKGEHGKADDHGRKGEQGKSDDHGRKGEQQGKADDYGRDGEHGKTNGKRGGTDKATPGAAKSHGRHDDDRKGGGQ